MAIALGALILNVLINIIGGVVWLAKLESKFKEMIVETKTDMEKSVETKIERLEANVDNDLRSVGEIGNALRQKIHEVELFGRDHFVTKDTFALVLAEIKTDFKQGFADLRLALGRMNDERKA